MGAGASELDGSSGTTEVGPPTVTAGCFTCRAGSMSGALRFEAECQPSEVFPARQTHE